MDIHAREAGNYYKESGISHYKPDVTQYARAKYNTSFEDENDLISLDMLDKVIVDAVPRFANDKTLNTTLRRTTAKGRDKSKKKLKRRFAIPPSVFTFLAN